MAPPDPSGEYERRAGQWRARAAALERRYDSISKWRGVVVACFFAALWMSLGKEWLPLWAPWIPLVLFLALMVEHERVAREQTRVRRAIGYFDLGLARVAGEWQGKGPTGEAYRDTAHPYADDLDVFGNGSLFQLISTARTAAGESLLASWLKSPSPAAEVRARQAAVAELAPRVDLRADLALAGDEIRAELEAPQLRQWGAASPLVFFAGARWIALLVGVANAIAVAAWFAGRVPTAAVLAAVLAAGLIAGLCRDSIHRVTAALGARPHDLDLLGKLIERLRRERFEAPRLAALQQRLGATAAGEIVRLERLVVLLDSARNQFFAIPAFFLAWIPQFAMAIERWRSRNGPHLGEWLDAVAELEALSSLAGYAFEHPAASFPELTDAAGPVLEVEAVEHPLIAEGKAVPNDVRLGAAPRLLMVSGSNMSGKSTLLRAVGLNTVLAWAGAPVRAHRMTVSRLAIGASIRATDSLLEGRSRFMAEITRLKQIQSLPAPALFLLDELLSGTNSHDRRIGAEAYLKGLLARGAIGLATTHDLALTQIAATLEPQATNMHLADTIEAGEVRFDYRLRPGVVARGNALALMRAVGLEVD